MARATLDRLTYRYPGVLVKTATTLDVLSHGRAYFGIGAAWNEEEHRGLGVPFPPLAERFERLEETLQIAHQMWSGNDKPYEGKYYQLVRPLNSPQAVQKPHPPILIGGTGERKTLRLVAQYGDACNIFARLPKPEDSGYQPGTARCRRRKCLSSGATLGPELFRLRGRCCRIRSRSPVRGAREGRQSVFLDLRR